MIARTESLNNFALCRIWDDRPEVTDSRLGLLTSVGLRLDDYKIIACKSHTDTALN
jgi:hypothetical protein